MVFKGRVPFGKGGTIYLRPPTVESSHLPVNFSNPCLPQQGKVGDTDQGGIAAPLTLTPAGAAMDVTPCGGTSSGLTHAPASQPEPASCTGLTQAPPVNPQGVQAAIAVTPCGGTSSGLQSTSLRQPPWGKGKLPVPTLPFQGVNSTPSGYPSTIPHSIVQGPLLVMVIPPHLPIPVNGLQHMGNPLLLGGVYRNCFLNSLDMQHLSLIPSFNLPKNLVNHIHFPCNNLCKSLQEGSLRPLEQLQGILGQFICLLKFFPLLLKA
jgi:hypothetical protein